MTVTMATVAKGLFIAPLDSPLAKEYILLWVASQNLTVTMSNCTVTKCKKFYKIDYISAPIHVVDLKIGMPGQVDVLNPKNVKLSISNNVDFLKFSTNRSLHSARMC